MPSARHTKTQAQQNNLTNAERPQAVSGSAVSRKTLLLRPRGRRQQAKAHAVAGSNAPSYHRAVIVLQCSCPFRLCPVTSITGGLRKEDSMMRKFCQCTRFIANAAVELDHNTIALR